MIISHRNKVCFWNIPRTGGSNIEMVVRLSDRLDLSRDVIAETHFYPMSVNLGTMPSTASGVPGTHRTYITPQTAVDNALLSQYQYDLYTHYCIVRDPVERFISSYHLALRKHEFNITKIVAEQIVAHPEIARWRKQVDYLSLGNVVALPYSDYVNSANTIFAAFQCKIPDQMPRVTRSHVTYDTFVRETVDPAQRQEIEAHYHEDMLLDF